MTDPVGAPAVARRPRPRLRLWSPRRTTVRTRLALLSALAVFVAVIAAGGATFGVTLQILRQEVDNELRAASAAAVAAVATGQVSLPVGTTCPKPAAATRAALPDHLILEVYAPGVVCRLIGTQEVETGSGDLLASGRGRIRDGRSQTGQPLRVLATDLGDGRTLIVARDLSDLAEVLGRLPGLLVLLGLLGGLLALIAGRAVAGAGLRPVGRLADAAEEIARTQDLSVRIEVPRRNPNDEVTRLADAFDRMTSALSAARERQTRLIADASHELRTPLTSLRTNIDLLLRSERTGRPVPADHRDALLTDLRAQLDELTHLAGELTVLANEEPVRGTAPVRLDAVVLRAVERARRRASGHRFEVEVRPWSVEADEVALERAVVNVLDNAVKFAPAGTTVTVRLRAPDPTAGRGPDGRPLARLTVDDEGPGIAPAHRERALERFWRSEDARAMPGSGLGLAIVAEAARDLAGRVDLAESASGGLRVALTVPGGAPGDRG